MTEKPEPTLAEMYAGMKAAVLREWQKRLWDMCRDMKEIPVAWPGEEQDD